MKKKLNTSELKRYSRHIILDGFGIESQLKLKSAKVLVVGAGGLGSCLLYTSDAADERSSVDLGGRRLIKKKKI